LSSELIFLAVLRHLSVQNSIIHHSMVLQLPNSIVFGCVSGKKDGWHHFPRFEEICDLLWSADHCRWEAQLLTQPLLWHLQHHFPT